MTRDQTQSRLTVYLAAELAILSGQEYQIGDGVTARKLRRANLAEVQAEIRRLSADLAGIDRRAAAVRSGRGSGAIGYVRPLR